ncbi:MAG TPA: tyrosine-protein phosphatase [Drouetiella sp.]
MKNLSTFRKVGLTLIAAITTIGITSNVASAQEHLAAVAQPAISAVFSSDSVIDNFGRVAPGITRGAQPSDKALSMMAKDGVKTIIDLRMNGTGTVNEESTTRHLGMKYVHIPMTLLTPSNDQVAQFLDVVNKPENLPVFIHCRQGADRTGTLVAIYRRKVQGWDFDKTYAEMRDHHFKPFLIGMKDLVRNCPGQNFVLNSALNTASAAVPSAPHSVSQTQQPLQQPVAASVLAGAHSTDKVMAGDLTSAGTMTMTVDQ